VVVEVADRNDPLVAFLEETIVVTDEIYQIRDFDVRGSRVLLHLDPTSVDLTQPNVHRHPYGWPLAWTRSYGVGRVFYTALGYGEGMWRDPRFQAMLYHGCYEKQLEPSNTPFNTEPHSAVRRPC
jgi:type 1 glutamine amidotransferase